MPTTRNDMNVANVRCMFTRGEFHRGNISTASVGGEAAPLPCTPRGVSLVLSPPGAIASGFPSGGRPREAETGCISIAELAGAASIMVSVWVAMLLWMLTSTIVDQRCARRRRRRRRRLESGNMDMETTVYIKSRQGLGGRGPAVVGSAPKPALCGDG